MGMGIYDREYYRREGPSFLGSLANTGQVCKWLILINVGVFLLQIVLGEGFTDTFLLDPALVRQGEIWRLLTYAFLHDPHSLWHILFNMLFLWWFGSDIEDLYGHKEFLAYYLVAAVLGGVAYELSALAGLLPHGVDEQGQLVYPGCLGASGAVTAVLVLFALHYPTRIIYFWFLPIPIWAFVGLQVLQDAFVFASRQRSGTAVTVHLGGAAFAFLYYKLHWRMMNLVPNLRAWQRERSRPPLRIYREEEREQPVPVAAPPAGDLDEQLEAKLDAVLEKVARYGQSSLTDTERQILLRASEIYKRRRS
jgi:membrane associated rhomboid family serine protease